GRRRVCGVRGEGLSAESDLARISAKSSRSVARRTPILLHAGRLHTISEMSTARRYIMADRLRGDGSHPVGRAIREVGGECQCEWQPCLMGPMGLIGPMSPIGPIRPIWPRSSAPTVE